MSKVGKIIKRGFVLVLDILQLFVLEYHLYKNYSFVIKVIQ